MGGLINERHWYKNDSCGLTFYYYGPHARYLDDRDMFYYYGPNASGWGLDDRDIKEVEGQRNWHNQGYICYSDMGPYQESSTPPEGVWDLHKNGAQSVCLKLT